VISHLAKFTLTLCSVALCILSQRVYARPELYFAKDFGVLMGQKRSSVLIVANTGSHDRPTFKLFAPTILPSSKSKQMIWSLDPTYLSEAVDPNDQILLNDEFFGPTASRPPNLLGCAPKSGVRIPSKRQKGRELYIAICQDEVSKMASKYIRPVSYDLKEGVLESTRYQYRFKPSNHMLFDSVKIKSSKNGEIEVAKDADLLIRADVKKFFNMQFDTSDIESKMKSSRGENVGAFANVGFYLNILFFKIAMDLTTDVMFFRNSSYIPMVLTTPVDAKKYLNHKSGVLYSFELPEKIKVSQSMQMPVLSGEYASAEVGLPYCKDSSCLFQVRFEHEHAREESLVMELILSRELVSQGMFPQFVQDVSSVAHSMEWELKKEHLQKKRVGFYMEISGLSQGGHPWDFWLDFKN
jgi:hypothetical protein